MSKRARGSHFTSPEHSGRATTPLRIGIGFAMLCLLGVVLILALPPGTPIHTLLLGDDPKPTAESTPWSPGAPTETADPTIATPTAPWPVPTDPSIPTAGPVPSVIVPPTLPPPPTPTGAFEGVIRIAVDMPTSGADASDGIPTRNGAELAIEQANAAGGLVLNGKPYRIEMYALDDAVNGVHNPQQGAMNASAFIADPNVLAVIGPFNTNVSRAMMPYLNLAGLAQIGPATSSAPLTRPEYGQTAEYQPTGKITFFRMSATDDLQGSAAADYLFDKLNAKNLYILDDTETYGKSLADAVEQRFRERGGTVAGHESVPKGTQDFRPILTRLAGMNPRLDGLFYGGTTSNALAVARLQMADAGLNIPFMGGDGILEDEFIHVAGDTANGSIATRAWANAAALPEAAPFLAAYRSRFGAEAGEYSAHAYDATNIIIDAIHRAGHPDRGAVRAAVAATDYQGVLGRTRFDAYGDTTNRWISIFTVNGGHWVFADQAQVPGTAPPPALPTHTGEPPASTPAGRSLATPPLIEPVPTAPPAPKLAAPSPTETPPGNALTATATAVVLGDPAAAIALTIWHDWTDDEALAAQKIFLNYTQQHPNVKIELLKPTGLDKKLMNTVPAGVGPDIVATDNTRLGTYALLGLIDPAHLWDGGSPPVDHTYLAQHYLDVAAQGLTYPLGQIGNPIIWALPEALDTITLIYNKKLISPEKLPRTTTELLQNMRAFNEANPGHYYAVWDADNPRTSAFLFYGAGASYVDEEGKVMLNSPEALATAKYIRSLQGLIPAGINQALADQLFREGKAPIIFANRAYAQSLGNTGLDYGLAKLPSVDFGKNGPARPFVTVRVLMVAHGGSASIGSPQAVDLIKFYTNADQQTILAQQGIIPANRDAVLPGNSILSAIQAQAVDGIALPTTPFANAVWDPLGQALDDLLTGTDSVEFIMDAAQKAAADTVAKMK